MESIWARQHSVADRVDRWHSAGCTAWLHCAEEPQEGETAVHSC